MSKRVMGERSDTALARSVLRRVPPEQLSVEEVEGEAQVYVSNAYFEFKSRNENFEPYMVLQCHMNSISGDFDEDINEIVFNDDENNLHPSAAPQCRYEYYPSRDEHCDMIQAGLYDRMDEDNARLKPGSVLFGATLSLPTKIKVYHVMPLSEDDSPITFVEVEDRFNIYMDALKSGYANEEEYNNGRIVGLLGAEYLDPVPEIEGEAERTSDMDFGKSIDFSNESFIEANDDKKYEVEEETPVEEIPLSDEDKAMLDKYVSIQEAANQRVAEMEAEKAKRLADVKARHVQETAEQEGQPDNGTVQMQSDGSDGFTTAGKQSSTVQPVPVVREQPKESGFLSLDNMSGEDEQAFE